LELFDLDEDFSTVESRLGRLANKCTENDLEYCVGCIGDILEVKPDVKAGEDRYKRILYEMMTRMVNFKLPTTRADSEPVSKDSDDM